MLYADIYFYHLKTGVSQPLVI